MPVLGKALPKSRRIFRVRKCAVAASSGNETRQKAGRQALRLSATVFSLTGIAIGGMHGFAQAMRAKASAILLLQLCNRFHRQRLPLRAPARRIRLFGARCAA